MTSLLQGKRRLALITVTWGAVLMAVSYIVASRGDATMAVALTAVAWIEGYRACESLQLLLTRKVIRSVDGTIIGRDG